MPDTFDLDKVFDSITDETGRSVPRGADAAIRASRRRRTVTATGGVLAAAAALTVGVSLVQPSEPTTAPPAGQDSQPVLPAPAPFTSESLNAATGPWVTGWKSGVNRVNSDGPCMEGPGMKQLPKPVAENPTVNVRLAQQSAGSFVSVRFASEAKAASAVRVLGDMMADCQDTQVTSNPVTVPPESGAEQWSWKSGEDTGELWYLQHGETVGIISLTGVQDAPEQVRDQVTEAGIAAILALPNEGSGNAN